MTEEQTQAIEFLLWLGTVCPRVYYMEFIMKGIGNLDENVQLDYITQMIDTGLGFWTNQELIYRNLPSLN